MWVSSVPVLLVVDVFAVFGVSAFFPTFSQRGLSNIAGRSLATPQVKPIPDAPPLKVTGDLKTAHTTPDDHLDCKLRSGTRKIHEQFHKTPDGKIRNSARAASSKGFHGVESGIHSPRDVAAKASSTVIHDQEKQKQVLSVEHVPSKVGSEFPGEEKRTSSTHDNGDKTGPKFKRVPSINLDVLHKKQHAPTINKVNDHLKKTAHKKNTLHCETRSGKGVLFRVSLERVNHHKDINGVEKGEHIVASTGNVDSKVPGAEKRTHSSHDTKGKTGSEVNSLKAKALGIVGEPEFTERLKKIAHSAQNGGVKSTPKEGKQPHSAQETTGQGSSKVTDSLKNTAQAHASATKLHPKGISKQIHNSGHDAPLLARTPSRATNSLKKIPQLAPDTDAKFSPTLTLTVKKQQHTEHHGTNSEARSKSTDSLKKTVAAHDLAAKSHSKDLSKRTQDIKHDSSAKIASKAIDSLMKAAQLSHETSVKSNLEVPFSVKKQQYLEQHVTTSKAGSKATGGLKKTVSAHGPTAKSHSKRTQDLKHDNSAKIASKAIDSLKKAAQLSHDTGAKSNPKLTSTERKQRLVQDGASRKAGSKATDSLRSNAQTSHYLAAKSHPKDISKRTQDLKRDGAAAIAFKVIESLKKAAQLPHDTSAKVNPTLTSSGNKQQYSVHQDTSGKVRSKLTDSQKNTASSAKGAASKTVSNSKVHGGEESHLKEIIVGNRMGNWLNSFLG